MQAFFSRHKRVILLLSAGKDSAACLKIARPFLDQITVVWVNPGNPYPETVEYMARIKASVPHFVELRGSQPDFIAKHGYPVDVVPVSVGIAAVKTIPFIACCRENLWTPAFAYIQANSVTGVIRGQKSCDVLRSFAVSNQVVDGVEYYHPIETWTDAQVFAFLGDDLPDSYKRGITSSLDCMNCTAYAAHNAERIPDLAKISPSAHAEVIKVHRFVRAKLEAYLELI